jgi:hypothetical protein
LRKVAKNGLLIFVSLTHTAPPSPARTAITGKNLEKTPESAIAEP